MNGERSFWARRKAEVAAAEEAEQVEAEEAALAESHAALEDKSDAEILAELNLPDPDTLKAGDDFIAFLAKTVPEHIRQRALRVLWRSNPVLANVDMLVDYGEDFTDNATVVDDIQTAYQVGKGMLRHVEEMARKLEPDDETDDEADTDAVETDAEPPLPEEDDSVRPPVAEPVEPAPMEMVVDAEPTPDLIEPGLIDPDLEEPEPQPVIPRRMKFTSEVSA